MFPKKRSVRYAWVLSYATVFFIPLIISAILYPVSNDILKKEIQKANFSLLKQAQTAIDDRLSDIQKLSVEISVNPVVRGLPYLDNVADEALAYNQVIQYLRGYRTTNSFLNEIYLYMHDKGALSSATFQPTDIFLSRLASYPSIDLNGWDRLLDKSRIPQFLSFCRLDDVKSECGTVAYLNELPWGKKEVAFGHLMFLVDSSKFLEPIQHIQWLDGGKVLILDENGRTIASTSKADFDFEYRNFVNPEGTLQLKRDGQSLTVAYTTSKVTKWKYISIIPTGVIREKSDYVRNIMAIGLLLTLTLGGLLTYLFVKRQYHPLRSLINGVGKLDGLLFDRKNNEYDFIQQAFFRSFNEKRAIHEENDKQKMMLKSSELARWLKGQLDEQVRPEEILSAYRIHFEPGLFRVMLFHVDEKGYGSSGNRQTKEWRLARFIISNTAKEIASASYRVVTIETDGMVALILNRAEDSGGDDDKDDLIAIEGQVRTFIGANYRIPYLAAVSQRKRDVESIPEAYKEATDAMEYNLILGQHGMTFYEEINPDHMKAFEWDYFSTMKAERKLLNFIKAGDERNARETLDEIFELGNIRSALSVPTAKFLMLHLIDLMVKTLYELNRYVDESFLQELNPVRRMIHCATIADIKREMGEILVQLCGEINRCKKTEGNVDLRDAVVACIEENYADVNLSVSMLGDRLAMTPDYLSRLFKEQTGIGLLDYLNRYRLEKAKILLGTDQVSIQDIATSVGFVNSNGFIRTFKKYEGVTPGIYRSFIAAHKSDA